MGIETFEFIDDLVAANPTSTDNVSEGDDHLRGLKTTLKNTFPNVTGAITPTETELNYVDGVTSAIQTQLDAKATAAQGTTADAALPKAGGALTGAVTTTSTFDGVDIATRDAILTSTTTTAGAALPKAGGTMTGAITTLAITETEATSSASTYTIDLANGTLFEVTHATLCTVTMPTAAAGKSFTVISTVPAAWSGTIIWSGGAAPTTGSAKTIYSFISNGSSWYGMQAGTGFA